MHHRGFYGQSANNSTNSTWLNFFNFSQTFYKQISQLIFLQRIVKRDRFRNVEMVTSKDDLILGQPFPAVETRMQRLHLLIRPTPMKPMKQTLDGKTHLVQWP
jgi:hypothetical protein